MRYKEQLTQQHRDYLSSRGYTSQMVEELNLGSAYSYPREKTNLVNGLVEASQKGKHPLFIDRIMFPIVEFGYIIGYSGRSLNPNYPKYINSRFNKGGHFYMGNQTLNAKVIYIVEGQIDRDLLAYALGVTVASTLGSAFTEAHAQKLLDNGIESVISLGDNDSAGKAFNKKVAEYCDKVGLYCQIAEFKDPNINDIGDTKGKVSFDDFALTDGIEWLFKQMEIIVNPYQKHEYYKENLTDLNLYQINYKTYNRHSYVLKVSPKYRKLSDLALGIITKEQLKFNPAQKISLEKERPLFHYLLNEMDFVIIDDIREELYFNNKRYLTGKEKKTLQWLISL